METTIEKIILKKNLPIGANIDNFYIIYPRVVLTEKIKKYGFIFLLTDETQYCVNYI